MLSDLLSDKSGQRLEENIQFEPSPKMLSDLEKAYDIKNPENANKEQWVTASDYEVTAIEKSLVNTQQYLNEKLLSQEKYFDNIVVNNQLT